MKRHFSKQQIMKQRPFVVPMVLTMMYCAAVASGQTVAPGAISEPSKDDGWANRNRFGFSYRMGLNISAKFKNLGGYQALEGQTRLTPDGDPYNYDDGYNLVDSTGDQPLPGTFETLTTYWGYDHANQVTPGNGAIVMHRSSSATGAATDDASNDPQHGFEFSYNRLLWQTDKFRCGLEAAFGYTHVSFKDGSDLSAAVTRLGYSFNLGGITPPPEGYQGLYDPEGAAVLLGDTPILYSTETFAAGTPGAAVISGMRELKADVYGLRLGPTAEISLGKGFAASVSAGVAVVGVSGDFRYQETASIPGAGTAPLRSGSDSKSDWLVGGYLGGNISYALTESIDVAAGVQYQSVGKYTQTIDGKKAELDLGKSIFITLGISYSF